MGIKGNGCIGILQSSVSFFISVFYIINSSDPEFICKKWGYSELMVIEFESFFKYEVLMCVVFDFSAQVIMLTVNPGVGLSFSQ